MRLHSATIDPTKPVYVFRVDTHDPTEPTPIYDQLIAETKARATAHHIRRARAQHVAEAIRKDRA